MVIVVIVVAVVLLAVCLVYSPFGHGVSDVIFLQILS